MEYHHQNRCDIAIAIICSPAYDRAPKRVHKSRCVRTKLKKKTTTCMLQTHRKVPSPPSPMSICSVKQCCVHALACIRRIRREFPTHISRFNDFRKRRMCAIYCMCEWICLSMCKQASRIFGGTFYTDDRLVSQAICKLDMLVLVITTVAEPLFRGYAIR